ncbi:MAG: hypothetical protein VXY99_16000, partial [Pseudomonadota bacterium]|nr:hypothetical protein [Pseudomonadota bacterium]
HGIALKNIRQRLLLIYGEQATFQIENVYSEQKQISGCQVQLCWPLDMSPLTIRGQDHVKH